MIARSRILAFGYRAVAALVIVIGIAPRVGAVDGESQLVGLLYYTVLSNVLCLGWMVLSALATLRDAQHDGWSGTSTPSPGRRRR